MKPDVTQILNQLGENEESSDEFVAMIYDELRQMAAGKMARERGDHTLQATALVNDAYLRLLGKDQPWENRRHFYGAASEAMRRILIESARRKQAEKRGSGVPDTKFRESVHDLPVNNEKLLEVHDVLDELEAENPKLAEVVKLRFFVGLTVREIAELQEVTERTVARHWELAKVWLMQALGKDSG